MPETAVQPAWRNLYDEAFRRFGARVPWSRRKRPVPVPGNAREVARALRVGGDMAALRLAEKLEGALGAAD